MSHLSIFFYFQYVIVGFPQMFTNRNMTNSIDGTQFSETWVAKKKCGIRAPMWHTCVCASMCQDWHSSEVKGDRHDWRKPLSKEATLSDKGQQQVAQYFNLLSSFENDVVLCKWKKYSYLNIKQLLKFFLIHENCWVFDYLNLGSSTR